MASIRLVARSGDAPAPAVLVVRDAADLVASAYVDSHTLLADRGFHLVAQVEREGAPVRGVERAGSPSAPLASPPLTHSAARVPRADLAHLRDARLLLLPLELSDLLAALLLLRAHLLTLVNHLATLAIELEDAVDDVLARDVLLASSGFDEFGVVAKESNVEHLAVSI